MQVAGDPEIPGLPARIAMVLAFKFMNRGNRQAWPSHETLARLTGSTEKPVGRAIDRLTERGHLRLVSAGGGRRKTNRYTWQFIAEKGDLQVPVSGPEKGDLQVPVSIHEKGTNEAGKRVPVGPPNLMKEPIERGAPKARPPIDGPSLVEPLYGSEPVSSQSTNRRGEGSALEASLPLPGARREEEVGEWLEGPASNPASNISSKPDPDADAIKRRLDELCPLIVGSTAYPQRGYGNRPVTFEVAGRIVQEADEFGTDVIELRQLVEYAEYASSYEPEILLKIRRYKDALEEANEKVYGHPDGFAGMLETIDDFETAEHDNEENEEILDREQIEHDDYADTPF